MRLLYAVIALSTLVTSAMADESKLKAITDIELATEYHRRFKDRVQDFLIQLEPHNQRSEENARQHLFLPPLTPGETKVYESYLQFLMSYSQAGDLNAQSIYGSVAHSRLKLAGGIPENRCLVLEYLLTSAGEGSALAAGTLAAVYGDGIFLVSSNRLSYLWEKEAHRRNAEITIAPPYCIFGPEKCSVWDKEWIEWSPRNSAREALSSLKKDECK
jgi:hypothetical protein